MVTLWNYVLRGTQQTFWVNFILMGMSNGLEGKEGNPKTKLLGGFAVAVSPSSVWLFINYCIIWGFLFQINNCYTIFEEKLFCKLWVFVQDMRRVWTCGRENSAHASQDQAVSCHGILYQVLPHHIHGQGKDSYPQIYPTGYPTHGLHQPLRGAALSQRQHCQLAQAHQTYLRGV